MAELSKPPPSYSQVVSNLKRRNIPVWRERFWMIAIVLLSFLVLVFIIAVLYLIDLGTGDKIAVLNKRISALEGKFQKASQFNRKILGNSDEY